MSMSTLFGFRGTAHWRIPTCWSTGGSMILCKIDASTRTMSLSGPWCFDDLWCEVDDEFNRWSSRSKWSQSILFWTAFIDPSSNVGSSHRADEPLVLILFQLTDFGALVKYITDISFMAGVGLGSQNPIFLKGARSLLIWRVPWADWMNCWGSRKFWLLSHLGIWSRKVLWRILRCFSTCHQCWQFPTWICTSTRRWTEKTWVLKW